MSALASAPTRTASATTLIRVASVPFGHVYVQHLGCAEGRDLVRRLPDPPARDASPQWWPPAMLDAGWVGAHADEFDVFHVHFGFDALDPRELAAVIDAVHAAGKPLVYTVHDLRNPHHVRRAEHDAHLDLLVPGADALITLTHGAAREIARRWSRTPVVIPHPHVVEFDRMTVDAPPHHGFVVGVHAKSVRPSMAPEDVITALLPLRGELPDLRIRVDVHHDVADPGGARHDPRLMAMLRSAAARGDLAVEIHDCFTDDELWNYLQGLDVSVLPYRFGTHSGWLEACHDLGTTVVAPSCGYFAEQRPCLSYDHDEGGLDAESLRAAVRTAYRDRPSWRAAPGDRRRERAEIASAHRALYDATRR